MDVASLIVTVQTKGVEAAQRELDKLGGTAGKAEKSVGGLASSMKALGAVATVGAIVSLGKEAVKMADSYKLVEARLSLVTKNTLELANAQRSLFNISQNTRQSFKETADLYASLARSTQQLGKTQTETLRVTETINKAIIISGASAQSAQAALVQLGQGFASGTLRGEELNSVLEQTPRIAEAIAKGMGVTIGQLRALGAEGKLTGESVFEALQNQAKAVDEEFSKIPPTVGQATTQIGNSLTLLAGTLDKATGATDALARSFSDLAKTLSDTALSIDVANKSVFSLKTADEFDKKTKLITDEINELRKALETDDGFLWFGLDERTTGEYQNRIKRLEQQLKQLGDTRAEVAKSLAPSLDDAMRAFQNSEKAYRSTFNPSKEEIEAEKKATKERIAQAEKLAEDWAKRKIEIATNIAIAEQDELAKPFIVLEAKYKEDLEYFKGNKEAQLMLTNEYNAEVTRLQKDLTKKFNEEEEKKAKKSAEWQVKLLEANEKYNDEIIKMQDEMYGTDTSVDAWYNNQLEYLGKLSQEAGATSEELQTLLDKIETIRAMKLEKQTISFKVEQSFYQSFENNLADSIEGAFNGDLNFKKFFKNIGNDLLKTVSSSFAGVGTSALRGNYSSALSALGIGASLIGSNVSASEIGSLMNSGATFDSATNSITTSGGSVIKLGADGSGTLSSGGSDLMSLASTVSSLNTAYNLISNGLSSTVMSGFSGLANLTGISGISQFGYGFTNPFAATNPLAGLYGSGVPQLSGLSSIGSTAGGMALGGLGGYALGSLGDKLFGADTKAGTFGAIGGALGSLGGPIGIAIGSALGSVVGGLFGSTKQTDAGLSFGSVTGMGQGFDDIQAYADMKKKSWFSSKSWTNYTDLTQSEINQIKGIFNTYDYLLAQLGDTDRIILEAGKYTGQSFQDALTKNFITAFTDIPQQILQDVTTTTQNQVYGWWDGYYEEITTTTQQLVSNAQFDEIYQAWVTYAESVDKTVMEALAESVASFTQSKRTFELWTLGDSVEALAKKAEFANADLEMLKNSMGATGVTVESFLTDFNNAVKTNFTPETITQWEQLGNALMSASDALEAYNNALESQEKALQSLNLSIDGVVKNVEYSLSGTDFKEVFDLYAQAFTDLTGIVVTDLATFNSAAEALKTATLTQEEVTVYSNLGSALVNLTKSTEEARIAVVLANQAIKETLLTTFSNAINSWESVEEAIANASSIASDTIRTFDELKNSSLDISNYQDLLDSLKSTQEKEISIAQDSYDLRVKQLNNEKSLFEDLSSYVDELNIKLLGGNVTSDYFFTELTKAKATFASGGSVDTSNLTATASSYLDYALQNSTSQLDYFREIAKVKEGIGSLGSMVTGGSLEGIQLAIASEEATLGFKLDKINETALAILSQWGSQAQLSKVSAVKTYAHIASDPVTSAFQEVLGRNPETDGYSYWMDRVVGGLTGEALKTEIANAALSFNIDSYTGSVSREAILASQANARNWVNGSHANGLDYVPFDGYIAQLHKGERVQTASEVQKDSIINELQNSLKDLKDMFIKNIAETSRMSRVITRLDDNDALLVRVVV